ncbi:efflux transporter outer membrane subunit [Piscinibacter sp.]|uniref:efflux transporter outer membrane subunit n=1 Tax=Piscinibacter sp. TaxID=1903157 RepID=UPI003559895B
MRLPRLNRLAPFALAAPLALALAACATRPAEPAAVAAAAPVQWQAPRPHNGTLTDLTQWWQQFNDPLLTQLIDSAQALSPTLASARTRIAQSRATRVSAGATLGPALNGSASVVRGRQDFLSPLGTLAQAGLQASWEIDLFGGSRAARDAAQARLDSAQAGWHEARVSVAAEVASNYLALRACEAQLVQTQADAASRAETARLTELSAKAGFQSPANKALAGASAAQARAQLTAQQAQCDLAVKALVALAGIEEGTLRTQLAPGSATLPQPAQISVAAVPAEALNQRPDLYAAARDLVAASAEVSQSQAQRLPRVSLAGSVGPAHFDAGGITGSGTLWAIGPVAVSLPLFDGGARAANVDAAQARYDEAAATYRGKLRAAVREVEEALVQLHSTAQRGDDARAAAQGFIDSYRATEARYRGGLASLFELEDARRNAVQAQIALIDLQRERVAAWISLYRALGGGWSSTADLQSASAAGASPLSK